MVSCGACQRCLAGGNPGVNLDHFRLKPLLRDFFRHLDVTRRYTLTLFRDGLLHRVDIRLRVYRVAKWEKREKPKNRALKMVEIDQKWEKWPRNGKIGHAKPMQNSVACTFGIPLDTPPSP
jgi:hypothetical protein